MTLIEIEPFSWELYQDSNGLYLNVAINKSAVSWEVSICLDKQAIQDYMDKGREFIAKLAQGVEISQLSKDYAKFYSYQFVSKEQSEKMTEAFFIWNNVQK